MSKALGVGEWMGEEYCGFYTVAAVGLEGLVCVCVYKCYINKVFSTDWQIRFGLYNVLRL